MAKIVQIEATPGFKAENKAQAEAYEAAVKAGILSVPYTTAVENIKLAGGIYRFVPAPVVEQGGVDLVPLHERKADELKMMLLTLGIEPKAGMKKAEMAAAITARLASIETEADE